MTVNHTDLAGVDKPRRYGGAWARLGWALWPPRCLVCGESGMAGFDLCPACCRDWPWLRPACLQCAMPLVGESGAGGQADADPAAHGAVTASDPSGAGGSGPGAQGRPGREGETGRASEATAAGTRTAETGTLPSQWAACTLVGSGRPGGEPQRLCGACAGRGSPLHEVRAACAYRAPVDALLPRFKFHRDLAAGRLLAAMMARAFLDRSRALTQAVDPSVDRGACPVQRSGGRPRGHPDTQPGSRWHGTWLHRASRTVQAVPGGSPRPACPPAPPMLADEPGCALAPVLLPLPLHASRLRQRGYDQALELARPLAQRLGLPLLAGGLARIRDTPPQSRLDAAQRQRNLRDAFAWTHQRQAPRHIVLIDDVMTTGATLRAAAQALRDAGAARVDAWVCARTL